MGIRIAQFLLSFENGLFYTISELKVGVGTDKYYRVRRYFLEIFFYKITGFCTLISVGDLPPSGDRMKIEFVFVLFSAFKASPCAIYAGKKSRKKIKSSCAIGIR